MTKRDERKELETLTTYVYKENIKRKRKEVEDLINEKKKKRN